MSEHEGRRVLKTVMRTCPACLVYKPPTGSLCGADRSGQTVHDDDDPLPVHKEHPND